MNSLITPSKGGAKAFKEYGINVSDFKDKSGGLKPIAEIFEDMGKKIPKGKQASFFHNVFGTTGQNAAQILSQNAGELEKVNKQVSGAYKNDYVGKLANKNMKSTQNSIKQFKAAADAVMIDLGTAMMPALSDMAKSMAKAFNSPDVQKGLKVIANGIKTLSEKIVDLIKWIGGHTQEIKTFGAALIAVFTAKKLIDGVSWLRLSLGGIKNLFGGITSAAGKNAISSEMEGVAGAAKSANGSTGTMLGSIGKMPAALKLVGSGLAALPAIMDLGGQISKTINTPSTKNKIKLASTGLGTAIGGVAGFAIGGPIGAGIGATIGDQLGSSKTAQGIVKKMRDSFNKAMNGVKIKVPRMDIKDAKKSMTDYSNALKKQQLADVKTLHDAGIMSDKEYSKRVAAIKYAATKNATALKKGGTDENAIARYYAKQRQDIDTEFNKKSKKIRDKYQTETDQAERTFGKNSVQYRKAKHKQEQVEDKNDSQKKKAIADLNYKYATTDMTKEAKAHMTLTGKINTESSKQAKIASKLSDNKKKFSASTVGSLVKDANEEYLKTTSLADKRYNKIAKAADKQRAKVASAADNQYKAAKAAADKQYNSTVDAAKNQYKGHSKWAEQQRAAVKKKAEDQRTSVVNAAFDQRKKTIDHADQQRKNVVDKATKEHDDTINKANDQKQKVEGAAKKRSKTVSEHAAKQANNSMSAASKQGKGEQSIWDKIIGVVNSIFKPFGLKKLKVQHNDFSYTPATTHGGYATGGTIKHNEHALVGEAGPELRYEPYSGVVDILGKHGPEFVKVKVGEKILNAVDTAKVLTGKYHSTLPGYAKGNISLNDFLAKTKDTASNVWDSIKDIPEKALKILKSPVKYLSDIVSKNIFGVSDVKDAQPVITDVAKASFKKGIKGIGEKLKDLAKEYDDNANAGNASNPSGSGVQRWKATIEKAAKKMKVNLTSAGMNAILKRIAQESNGNPTIQNNWDSNAQKGVPSKGLLQYIQPTLSSWVPKGTKANLSSGYAQLVAMFNDSNWLRDISVSGGWGPTGHKRFENGGLINNHGMYEIGEGNKPEMVIPLDSMKSSRAEKLIGQVVSKIAHDNPQSHSETSLESASQNDFSELNKKFDTLLGMFGQLLGVNGAQLQAIKNSNDPTARWKNDALAQSALNYQSH